jgi:hypothetical protein
MAEAAELPGTEVHLLESKGVGDTFERSVVPRGYFDTPPLTYQNPIENKPRWQRRELSNHSRLHR